jgi:uncharacterized protein (TIGR00369 family)
MQFQTRIPFVEALGFELLRFEGGEAEIGMTPRAEHMNSLEMAHGGVVMTLLDVAMAHAARSAAAHARGVLTIEMKTSFMRPGVGRLRAHGKLLRQTRSMAFCEASLFDIERRLLAHATGTFKYLRALPPGATRGQPIDGSD